MGHGAPGRGCGFGPGGSLQLGQALEETRGFRSSPGTAHHECRELSGAAYSSGRILEGAYASSWGVNSCSGEAKITGSDDLSWGLSYVTSSSKLPSGGLKSGLESGDSVRTHTY